ncbi:MAG: TIGR04211 family SH3 domain-containing protein [Deltaproteobacteria bacterium]|nr:TIGR04211 family SH3 domain-containing protein [Deltaproteobacteria bacterium]
MRITAIRSLRFIIFLTLLSFFTVFIGIVDAKTQYVSDQLIINMREGKGNEYKIIKMLTAGTPLEIIEESQQYLKVRTQNGQEGWVLKQYITLETPKNEIIAGLEKEIARLKTKLENYQKDKDSLQEQLKTAKADYSDRIKNLNQSISGSREEAEQTSKELKEVSEKYNTLVEQSKNIIELTHDRDRLKAVNNRLSTETEHLRKENSRLKYLRLIWWFLAGGGVFFVGWIIGSVSRKKRSLQWD